jgi:hypothetical protein
MNWITFGTVIIAKVDVKILDFRIKTLSQYHSRTIFW